MHMLLSLYQKSSVKHLAPHVVHHECAQVISQPLLSPRSPCWPSESMSAAGGEGVSQVLHGALHPPSTYFPLLLDDGVKELDLKIMRGDSKKD